MDVEAFRALAPLCWRAPSAHNTQPWRLRYESRAVRVGWDPADALPAADPTGRDLRLSLGAFVETCLVVAADAGLAVRFDADHCAEGHRIGWLRGAGRRYDTPFGAAGVRDRRTHRGRYLTGPEPEVVADLDALARTVGARFRAVPDAGPLPGLIRAADQQLYADSAIAGELRSWLRLTPRHPRYHADGLTDRALALSRAEAAGLRAALAGYPLLRRVGLPRILAAAGGNPLALGGDVLVLVGPPDLDDQAQVTIGRALLRIWLTVQAAGLAAHPLSQLLDAPVPRAALAAQFGVAPQRLLHVVRVGRPATAAAPSARRRDQP
ncbi:nitroreductase [Plantactinospora sp. S1510]|uniref:Nitroreductase n=1 Tax=Plantactinospora alkalitolerans TaxID=2789879 RepID=A0ABS0GYD9_9ACTN|nr:nitroreductase [Plantactinospora alkalitolerans]MBF9131241.1 nitroreductase [Plantactinospora alkalitolerans]